MDASILSFLRQLSEVQIQFFIGGGGGGGGGGLIASIFPNFAISRVWGIFFELVKIDSRL